VPMSGTENFCYSRAWNRIACSIPAIPAIRFHPAVVGIHNCFRASIHELSSFGRTVGVSRK